MTRSASTVIADIEKVGAGGLGDVYRAVRVSTGGHVAIKVVREHGDRDTTDRRVRRELDALLKLKGHPNVVQIEELIALPTGLALVMEFVGGGSLMDLLNSYGPLRPAQVVVAIADITRAIADAHALGIVHRDIKPHNVMVGQFGQCKVCDFGIAAVLKDPAFSFPVAGNVVVQHFDGLFRDRLERHDEPWAALVARRRVRPYGARCATPCRHHVPRIVAGWRSPRMSRADSDRTLALDAQFVSDLAMPSAALAVAAATTSQRGFVPVRGGELYPFCRRAPVAYALDFTSYKAPRSFPA